MKYLLLFLLSFNLYAQEVGCGLDSHEEIDACTLLDKLGEIFPRLYPSHSATTELMYNTPDPCDPLTVDDPETTEVVEVCPPWDTQTDRYYYAATDFDEETGEFDENLYERLTFLDKPATSASFQGELLVWKQEKKDHYDFMQSLEMDRFRRRMVLCSYTNSNEALLKQEIAANKDLTKRDCLLSHTAVLDTEDAQAAALADRIKDERYGSQLINQILLGMPAAMPATDKLTLLTYVNNVRILLMLGDIDGARDVALATPLTTLYTEPFRDFIVGSCNTYLGE